MLTLIVLMLVLFEQLLSHRESDVVVVVLFSTSLVSLVTSLSLFTFDMKRSLRLIHQFVDAAEREEEEMAKEKEREKLLPPV